MADICVLYVSEDEAIVGRLVELLRRSWSVWWAKDLAGGPWEEAVRAQISAARIVVPVISSNAVGKRVAILKDEMHFATNSGKPVLPFEIANCDMPFGFGGLDRCKAIGWDGSDSATGFGQLRDKLARSLRKADQTRSSSVERQKEIVIGSKTLMLPSFVFSLSSHETQLSPLDGLELMGELRPAAALVSAYDVSAAAASGTRRRLVAAISEIKDSETVLFLDSGNYEAYRKNDRYSSKSNPDGWNSGRLRDVLEWLDPDVAFAFDNVSTSGTPSQVAKNIVKSYHADSRFVGSGTVLCPIIHVAEKRSSKLANCAADTAARVAKELDPAIIAVPERELGQGIRERAGTVRLIRHRLNELGKYYPLHLLGTGNPISMITFGVAGADLFDGLEWCRTVADYSDGTLYHFQQYECVAAPNLRRVRDAFISKLLESDDIPYALKTVTYNVDYFEDCARSMREMIHAGLIENLLKSAVPGIGAELYADLR